MHADMLIKIRSFILPKKKYDLCFKRTLKITQPYSTTSLGFWNSELDESIKKKIEDCWKDRLKNFHYNATDKKKQKFFVLSMFPYPSGNLHIGHVRVYTISDSIARFHRMLGKNVFHPMGWDAFGLPAENAAIERGVSADDWTRNNIKTMKQQLQDLACCFDWDRELATCHSGYYKFTQDIFLRMFEAGLVYQKEALVNWDPVDQTVLADEQVDEQGLSWRSGAKVLKKPLRQWFIRTTRFAKSLYDGLDDPVLEDWRDIIKLQKHWIGECTGTTFDFLIVGMQGGRKVITVWTDKAEHLRRAKFIAVAPGSLLDRECDGDGSRKLNIEAVNPINGESIPVYVTGVIEGFYEPESDVRLGIPDVFEVDREFVKLVNLNVDISKELLEDNLEERSKVCSEAMSKNYGGFPVSAKLRDWLISRQRHWGTPIPLIHCKTCGHQPVKYEDLPVILPKLETVQVNSGSTTSLQYPSDWKKTTCPKCGGEAERETDTMDTFVDSSWYYLRYTDPRNENQAFDIDVANELMPVDIYVGGKEHAVLHLYYARFMSHFLHSIGWLKEREPFKRMLVQGMVMGKTYRVKGTGRYLKENEIERKGKKVYEKGTDGLVIESWEKMSKSKYNGVDPAQMLKEYGIDTTRLLVLADVAPTSSRNWNSKTFPGILKWQHRLWLTVGEFLNARQNCSSITKGLKFDEQEEFVWDSRNYYLKGATFMYSVTHQLSVAISKMQGLTGSLRKSTKDVIAFSGEYERALAVQIIMLAPIAPHFASELWTGFCEAPGRINKVPGEIEWDRPLVEQSWPQVDKDYNLDLSFLVNGHEKSSIKIPRKELETLSKEEAESLALANAEVIEGIAGRPLKNVTYRLLPAYQAQVNLITVKISRELEKSAE